MVQRRNKPEAVGHLQHGRRLRHRAGTTVQVLCEWPGWWCTTREGRPPPADGTGARLAKKRHALWEKIQALFYEDAARIKLGDYFRMDGRRADVQGYQAGPYMRFWNVWLDRK